MPDPFRRHGVAEKTIYRWNSKFGGMEVSDAKRSRELKAENRRLKHLRAEAELDKAVMEEIIKGNVVTARHRLRVVEHSKGHNINERSACRLVRFLRTAMWKPLQGRKDSERRARLKWLAERYPQYCNPTLHDMLRPEDLVRNPKRAYRMYREEGLEVRGKRR